MIPALPFSVLESWLLTLALVLVGCAIVALLDSLNIPRVRSYPDERGPSGSDPWSRKERLELVSVVALLLVAVLLACVLGPTLDHHDSIAKDTRNTAYAAKE